MQSSTITQNLKKYFYSGIGLASHTGEIVQHSVNEFVKQGRVSESDGKKIVDNAIKKVESRMPELEAKYREAVNKALKFANAEIEVLRKKIASLERKGGAKKAAKAPVKKTAGKTAAKSTARKSTSRKRQTAK